MQRLALRLVLKQGFGRCAMATYISPSTRPGGVSKFLIELGRELFGSYRPEKHYMRGVVPTRSSAVRATEEDVRDANQDIR